MSSYLFALVMDGLKKLVQADPKVLGLTLVVFWLYSK